MVTWGASRVDRWDPGIPWLHKNGQAGLDHRAVGTGAEYFHNIPRRVVVIFAAMAAATCRRSDAHATDLISAIPDFGDARGSRPARGNSITPPQNSDNSHRPRCARHFHSVVSPRSTLPATKRPAAGAASIRMVHGGRRRGVEPGPNSTGGCSSSWQGGARREVGCVHDCGRCETARATRHLAARIDYDTIRTIYHQAVCV